MSVNCLYCGCYDNDMEFCFNEKCNNYICLQCSFETVDNDIICHECSIRCNLCNCILNRYDNNSFINIKCSMCQLDTIYCQQCNVKYHIQNCRNLYCPDCIQKCYRCKNICCTIHTDGYCRDCFVEKYFNLKDNFIDNILRECGVDKCLTNIILSYCL